MQIQKREWEDVFLQPDEVKQYYGKNDKSFEQTDYAVPPLTSPALKNLKELVVTPDNSVFKRNELKVESRQSQNNDHKLSNQQSFQSGKYSQRSQMHSSQRNNSSKNSLGSQNNNNFDKRFIKQLLSNDEKSQRKWYFLLAHFFRLTVMQLINPIIQIIGLFKNQSQKMEVKTTKQKCILLIFRIYFFVSAVLLWMAIINYIYIRQSYPTNENEFTFLTSEYHKVFMYFIITSIAFTVLDTSIFKNSILFYLLFKSISFYSSINLSKYMKELFISDHDFMFQFFDYPFEDEKKLKEKQKIKKVFRLQDKNSPFFTNNEYSQYYSGFDLCQKIIQFSEKKNVDDSFIFVRQILLSLIIYVKAFIPGIYREVNNQTFTMYSLYLTVVPYVCVGNVIGYLARSINSLQDLNFIYDYNTALCALITYDSYLKLKPKYKINTPSINPIDIKSIKTWQQMRKLLNQIKKEDTLPIDRCTLFLFIYLVLIFLTVFLDKFFKFVLFFSLSSERFLVPYYSVDVVMIALLFCYRVYKQTQINEQYKKQYKLLQNVKNILIRFFVYKESYIEKENIELLDKDIQWHFFSQLNQNFINSQQLYIQDYLTNSKRKRSTKILKGSSRIKREEKQLDISKFDFEYSVKLINLIEYMQVEIQIEILESPMKFLGLLPSSYGLLWTFLSFTATFIYLAFYLYLNDNT